MTLVESAPIETSLDHPDIPNADAVWREMFASARESIALAQFYASDEPNSRLSPLIKALQDAAARGVRVRFLADLGFSKKYPETLEQLGSKHGIELRTLDVKRLSGGVQHAKYFVVDGREAYLGSQNFDWRALTHIQEIGVRLRSQALAGALGDVFETDWALAEGKPDGYRHHRRAIQPVRLQTGEEVTFTASPKGWLPDEGEWDLPRLVSLIDGAQQEVGVQVLSYSTRSYSGETFTVLDEALRRAAARGARVRLLVSDWSNRPGSDARRALLSLGGVAGVEVRVITIPRWSGGEIPFARVCHAKYMVVDGQRAWVGTSNWDGDYFLRSRNVGVVVESADFARRLIQVLDDGWNSTYSAALAP